MAGTGRERRILAASARIRKRRQPRLCTVF
jgi:hypothetical protein